MRKIVIASRNEGKIDEIRPYLVSIGYKVYSLSDFDSEDVRETGATFRQNALIKARAARRVTNFMILAEDSGLEVDALNGKPGVYSARFSESGTDEANNVLLLKKMEDKINRRARFISVMVLKLEDDEEMVFTGSLDGYIHTVTEGDAGFGYDPLFIPVGHCDTLSTLGPDRKTRISHRRKALDAVLRYLKTLS